MGCLNCDCDGCQRERQVEDERVEALIKEHNSPRWRKAYGKCNCFYCYNNRTLETGGED